MFSRRRFLQTGLASLGMYATNTALANGMGLLSNIVNASNSVTDYKTLVCVNLNGGADTLSLFMPTDAAGYSRYENIRNNLAYSFNNAVGVNPRNRSIGDIGMPSFMQSAIDLFNDEKLSIVSNVGPLREPTSLSMIDANPGILPPFIGSHNSQEAMWQAGIANPSVTTGWGARLVEALHTPSPLIPSNISLNGTRRFLQGRRLNPYAIDPEYIPNLDRYVDWGNSADLPARELFNQLVATNGDNPFLGGFTDVVNSAMNNNQVLSKVLADIDDSQVQYNAVSDNSFIENGLKQIVAQFKRAAQLIESAPLLKQHRQIIFIEMNGFDTHDNQDVLFPDMIRAVFDSMKTFQADLEKRGVDDRVVTFTQSEFGRTITINSNGTDHGWGGHQFVMGTPVNGGQVIGELPEYEIGSRDVYQNMFIPQYSVEQYGANLAKWFGLSATEFTDVFPNYERFNDIDFNLFV